MRIAIWQYNAGDRIVGGHTTQLVKLAERLEVLGHEVTVSLDSEPSADAVDVLHGMAVPPKGIAAFHRRGVPVVLSPVYWASSSRAEVDRPRAVVARCRSGLGAFRAAWNGNLFPVARVASPRLYQALLSAESADRLLPNARGEYSALIRELGITTPATVVPNAADPEVFDAGPSPASRDAVVVCAGRIEPHKNQLALIAATRDLGVKLLLAGDPHPHHVAYYRKCRDAAERSDVEFLGGLSAEALAETFGSAAVHVLPSWFETTGLVSLEAALAGAKIVSTSRGYASEYLEQDAWYCSPASEPSIRSAIADALEAPWQPRLRDRILERFTWAHAADATVRGYEAALG